MAASSSSVVPTEELRYLLVSNGFVIFLLDLKQKEEALSKASDSPPLPVVATFDLIEKGLPILSSLFKLGSDVYLIGGECRSQIVNYRWPMRIPFKAASRDNYCISFASDEGKGTLSAYKGNKWMKFPKIRPIVEKIGNEVHVFDGPPYSGAFPNDGWVFTHETLDLNEIKSGSHGSKIRTKEADIEWFFRSHVVMGDRIFAYDGGGYWEFFSEGRYWHKIHRRKSRFDEYPLINKYSANTVWEIMEIGELRCALKAPNGLFVVIALVGNAAGFREGVVDVTAAMAYLVWSTGEVVCHQSLDHFFNDSMQPINMNMCKVINADEEGKTMCSIVIGDAYSEGIDDMADDEYDYVADDEEYDKEYLFVNIFTVTLLPSFDFFQHKSRPQRQTNMLVETDCPKAAKFVSVDVKERHIFKVDVPHALSRKRVQACFM